MIYLFDNALHLIKAADESTMINATLTDEPNSMIFSAEAKNDGLFDGVLYVGFYHPDEDDNFLVFRLAKVGTNLTKTVTGVHLFYDDLRGRYVQDARPENKPVAEILTRYLAGTGWTLQNIATLKTTSENAYYISALEAVSKLTQETGIIIRPKMTYADGRITRKTLSVSDTIGTFLGRRFRDGVDGCEVTCEEDTAEIYTALIGRGAGLAKTDEAGDLTGGYTRRLMFDSVTWTKPANPVEKPAGQIYVELPDRTALYGYPNGAPRVGIIEFDKIEDPELLLENTYKELEKVSRPQLTFRVTRANSQGVHLGDEVVAIRDGLSFRTSIFRAVHNLKNRALTEYEFGDKIISATTARFNKIASAVLATEQKSMSLIAQLKGEFDAWYWGEDGYNYDLKTGNEYGLPAGYYSFNAPINQNPTKVVYMGAGKMMISNEKDAAGKWIWKTAATGDGFYASSMFADFITGNLIRGSVIESIKRSTRTDRAGQPVSYWDLDNGHIESESANIYGDLYVDSKKYSYRHYNVGEWLDKVEELSSRADQTAAQASDAAASAYSAAQSAQTSAGNAYSAAGNAYSAAQSAQNAANAANQALNTFLQPAVNLYGHPTSAVQKIWVVYYSGTYYLEVQPQGYSGATSWSVRLESISN